MRKTFFVVCTIGLSFFVEVAFVQGAVISDFNETWNSPSVNSQGSMPLGNGDIGVNVWTENGQDLVFYISKTDAWDDNGTLMKLGKVRVNLPYGTFSPTQPFSQEFRLQDGTIQIDAGQGAAATTVKLWIDPNNPVVQVDIQKASNFQSVVSYEPWRTSRRLLGGKGSPERSMTFGLRHSPNDVYVEADTTLTGETDRIVSYHRNELSNWSENLTLTGHNPSNTIGTDPLLHNTFGVAITGTNLESYNSEILWTPQASNHQVISIHALTSQTDTAQQWRDQLDQQIAQTESTPYVERKAANDQWWNDYNAKSYIRITDGPNAEAVSRGYAIQRSMKAFSGRGDSPIKFNGSIFTVDTYNRPDLGEFNNLGPDFRKWGGGYWLQNTRLLYWSMLNSGDYDQMQPFFDLYVNNLEMAKERVKIYYGPEAKGAYFPESMTHWGTWDTSTYNWNSKNTNSKADPTDGYAMDPYTRYEWQGGIEVTAMMLQYYDYTKDNQFVGEKLLPLAQEVVTFYDTHYSRDGNGKLFINPATALETWWTATNPLPEVAGLHYVLDKLLALPESETTAAQRAQWTRLKGELPDVPTQSRGGATVYAPAEAFDNDHNLESPELYGVFPYQTSGVGKDSLQMGIDTYNTRYHKLGAMGWSQDPIFAAMLGQTGQAQDLVTEGFLNSDPHARFSGFLGPNYDWTPDQDQASVSNIALQRMLLQVDGDHVELFPAWPSDWDVEFRMFGPNNTIIMGEYGDGAVQWMDPNLDGLLTQADHWLILLSDGYDNGESLGDFESLQLGDVNLDGKVTNADVAALFAAAIAFGIDVSEWNGLIPGDANLDGEVNGSDVAILAGAWQYGAGSGDPNDATWLMGDFTGDGQIDGSDIAILAGNWQYGVIPNDASASVPVPEPSTIVLLLAAVTSLLVLRRGKRN